MTRRWQLGFGVVLTMLAGFIDALGFIRLGGFYTSFMSGNTTQFAVALGRGDLFHAVLPAVLIVAFLTGAVTGGALAALTPTRWVTPAVLAFETVAVTAALVTAIEDVHIGTASLFLALAMGGQNAVLAHVQGFRAGTTFITGALFSFGQKAALALAGRAPRMGWFGDAAVWIALLIGEVAGTLTHAHLGAAALAIPACVAGGLCLGACLVVLSARPGSGQAPSRF